LKFVIKGKYKNVTGIHSKLAKNSNELPSIIQSKFSKTNNHISRLFKGFQEPSSFSCTFKATNLQLLNPSTFKQP